ncbi:MAG: hypothetical protein C0436_04420 [Alphaproteobacteria bacterium]|nr:hypothetical protein [Alphaproteobacteria bacterium]
MPSSHTHTLLDERAGRAHAPSRTPLDPLALVVEYGLTDATELSLSETQRKTLHAAFDERSKNEPWNSADRAFAHEVCDRYFEAFHLRHHLNDAHASRKKSAGNPVRGSAVERGLSKEESIIKSLHKLNTSTISSDSYNHIISTRFDAEDGSTKTYDSRSAMRFLGTIIRHSIDSYIETTGILPRIINDTPSACHHIAWPVSIGQESQRLRNYLEDKPITEAVAQR